MESKLAITDDEEKKLFRLEKIIEKGQKHFLEVGNALLIIRNVKLYKSTFETFAEYCKQRWGYGKSYAYYLIGSAKVSQNLSTMVDTATSERQVRSLTTLKSKRKQRLVWKRAKRKAKGGEPTSEDVEEAVREATREENEPETEPVEDTPVLKKLKFFWEKADSYEREMFWEWTKNG